MNAIGMMSQQFMKPNGVQPVRGDDVPSGNQRTFQSLLKSSGKDMGSMRDSSQPSADFRDLVQKLLASEDVRNPIGLTASEKDAEQVLTNFITRLTDKGETGITLSAEQLNSPEIQLLNKLIQSASGQQNALISSDKQLSHFIKGLSTLLEEGSSGDGKKTQGYNGLFLSKVTAESSQVVTDPALQDKLAKLFANVENLLAQITDQKSIAKAAPELLKMLEQWTSLAKESNQQPNALLELMSMKNARDQSIWRELVQSFQKRNQLATSHQYNMNAKVTSSDVAKWLHHAVQNQAQLDKNTTQQTLAFTSSMPMSKVEQYVIHLNQTNSQPDHQQLVEQFQKVMKTSKFLSMQNGTSQLNISLRPENLGDMMVKLTQMNGEMTVKIVVTSAAAKEMLETNMHQLKNMFSPQQVVIEKQETATQQTQASQQEEDGQPMDDNHDQAQSDNSESDDSEEEDDFLSQLQDVLMNEKV